MADLVEVFRSPGSVETRLVAAALEHHGSKAVALSESLAATIGIGTFAVQARVMVPAGLADEARATLAVLDAIAEDGGDQSGPDACPGCGAAWEPGFAVCWQRQRELPSRSRQSALRKNVGMS